MFKILVPKKPNPFIELYLGIFLLSFTGVFAKLISWHALPIIFWRSAITSVVLFLFLKLTKRTLAIQSKKDRFYIVGLGVLMMTHWVTYYWAIQLSTVAIGMISLYTFPVISALLEPIFSKEKVSISELVSSLAVIIGIVIMNPTPTLTNQLFLGTLVGIGSAVLYALRNILSRPLVKKYSGEVIMFYQMLGAVILIPFLPHYDITWTPNNWVYILALSIICTAFAHTLWIRSLTHFKATTSGTISCLAPALGAIIAIYVVDEPISQNILIGGIIILATTIFETRKHAK